MAQTAPGAPTITSVTAGINSALIYFTPPASNGGAAITNYQYSIDGGNNWVTRDPVSIVSPIEITGLTNCAALPVQIRAVNSVGAGTASSSSSVTPRSGQGLGINWTAQTATSQSMTSVTYGNGLFVSVSKFQAVMTSPDGITWTNRTTPFGDWQSVTWGNGIFVAVGFSGAVMTSPNGINWTLRTSFAGHRWKSVTYGNGLFVAVSDYLIAPVADGLMAGVMTSPDGITWTLRTSPTRPAPTKGYAWQSIIYANGLFVATAKFDELGSGERLIGAVMTSPDGFTWTLQTLPAGAEGNQWSSITYGNGLFVTVSTNVAAGTARVMTSPDGINWTYQPGAKNGGWYAVTYGGGLFVAVSVDNQLMTSPDGVNWTTRTSAGTNNNWSSITYANQRFVAVTFFFGVASNRVMVSSNLLVPDKPVINSISSGTDNLIVDFTAPADVGGSPISNYEYSIDNGISWTALSPAATTSPLILSGLSPTGFYQVQLRAVNTQGSGCSSATALYSGTLPVTLIRFDVSKHASVAKLDWTTAFEQNNKGFHIQRSANGRDFTNIGFVAARGNGSGTDYTFTDAAPLNGRNFYRLQQEDEDGQRSLSAVRTLDFRSSMALRLYPNPVQRQLALTLGSTTGALELQLTDLQGRPLLQWKYAHPAPVLQLDLGNLAAGMYLLTLRDATGAVETMRVLKQ